MSYKINRRTLIKGAAVAGGSAFILGPDGFPIKAHAQGTPEPAVLLVYLNGGYNALFTSAGSFAPAGTFGVANPINVGTAALRAGTRRLSIDGASFGAANFAGANTVALQNIPGLNLAGIGVNHGSDNHGPAQDMQWTAPGGRSAATLLAARMGGTAPIRAAVLGQQMPPGPRTTEEGVSLQTINDLAPTVAALGGAAPNPDEPLRGPGAAGIASAKMMSQPAIGSSSHSLRTANDAYDSTYRLLTAPVKVFNYNTMAQDYGLTANGAGQFPTAVNGNFRMKMIGAELMIQAGAKVAVAVDGGWDTHGDSSGAGVRNQMRTEIVPGLHTFLRRMAADTTRNVTTIIFGDFARSLPGSDHARGVSVSVFGRNFVHGLTTGDMTANVGFAAGNGLPTGVAAVNAMWSALAAASGVSAAENPFGPNPHNILL